VNGSAAGEVVAAAEEVSVEPNVQEGNQPIVNASAAVAVNRISNGPNAPRGNSANTPVGVEGTVVVGGRKRRHRKHKKMTHKRRH
jgi:hypothetical protein